MGPQFYYLLPAICLLGRTSAERPSLLGVAVCGSHTSILQDGASEVFDKGIWGAR